MPVPAASLPTRPQAGFLSPVLRPAVPCINSCRKINDADHADGTGAFGASTSCMVVMVRLIAAGSQDTSHIVPARPYLALLECRMRGDAAAGSRAIAALAWCCLGLRSPGLAALPGRQPGLLMWGLEWARL